MCAHLTVEVFFPFFFFAKQTHACDANGDLCKKLFDRL